MPVSTSAPAEAVTSSRTSLILPRPVKWMICAWANRSAAEEAMARSSRLCAPSGPPVTSTSGRFGSTPSCAADSRRSADGTSRHRCVWSGRRWPGATADSTRSTSAPARGLRPVALLHGTHETRPNERPVYWPCRHAHSAHGWQSECPSCVRWRRRGRKHTRRIRPRHPHAAFQEWSAPWRFLASILPGSAACTG